MVLKFDRRIASWSYLRVASSIGEESQKSKQNSQLAKKIANTAVCGHPMHLPFECLKLLFHLIAYHSHRALWLLSLFAGERRCQVIHVGTLLLVLPFHLNLMGCPSSLLFSRRKSTKIDIALAIFARGAGAGTEAQAGGTYCFETT
jgi:hypothetical protein